MRSIFRDSYRYASSIIRGLDTSGAETRAPKTDEFGRLALCPVLPQPPRLSEEEEAKRRAFHDAIRAASADVWCLGPQTTEIVRASNDLCKLADFICHVDCEVEVVKAEVFNKLSELEKLGWNVTEVAKRLCDALAV